MTRNSAGLLVLGVIAAATALYAPAAAATAPAGASDPASTRPFSVAVDNCRSGFAEGILDWQPGPSIGQAVRVQGVVADRPAGPCVPTAGRYTEATFRAYYGNTVVDTGGGRADDAVVPIEFVLAATPGIDRVEVEVCRRPAAGTGAPVCASQVYPRPGLPGAFHPLATRHR